GQPQDRQSHRPVPPARFACPRRRGHRIMRRREIITLLGVAAAWPLAARAQQSERVRRVGVLLGGGSEGDAPTLTRIGAFRQGLAKLGWVEERTLKLDIRFGGGNAERTAAYAAELVRLAPDGILAGTGDAV